MAPCYQHIVLPKAECGLFLSSPGGCLPLVVVYMPPAEGDGHQGLLAPRCHVELIFQGFPQPVSLEKGSQAADLYRVLTFKHRAKESSWCPRAG